MNSMKKQITLLQIVIFFVLITSFTQTTQAKSVYAIINHPFDIIGAYKIQGNQIEYQTEIQAPQHGNRAIDLAIDSDSSCIFVTYENSSIIEIMNAKTLENEGSVTATGASNLAGIVFDDAKQKLYTADRGTNKLFVYLWDPVNKTLTLEGGTYKTLANLGYPSPGAYGITLNQRNNCLYVADFTWTVRYYDTNDWSYQGNIDVHEVAVDIEVDWERGYLYAGGYTAHGYLVKFNLSTVIAESNDIGAGVIGLGVDCDSGLVYTTTYHNQLRVYDTSTSPFTLTDYEGISAGCGVCVPTGDVGYKPLRFYIRKVDVNEPNSVLPGDYITYQITYGPNGVDHNNVVITDYLPCEVDPNNPLDPNYNSQKHTYTWQIGSLAANDPNKSVTLTVCVNQLAEPLGTITNHCEIESDVAYSTAETNTPVGCWGGDIIYVDQNAPGLNTGLSWQHAYWDLQDALARVRAGCGSQIRVAAGTYKPTQNPEDTTATFDLVSGVPIYGGFPTGGGERRWMTNETILDGQISGSFRVSYVVTADGNEDVTLDGFTIRGSCQGGAGIYLNYANNVAIDNCKLKENYGYGIICTYSSPVITNSTFDGNNITTYAISAGSSDVRLANCIVKKHTGYGIDFEYSNIEINRSLIERNSYDGIHCYTGSTLTLTNSVIRFNGDYYPGYSGVYLEDASSATIKNNWIHNNGTGSYGDGIIIGNLEVTPIEPAIIRNNTIVNNARYGICRCWPAPEPNISNCIIWGNETGQLYDCSADYSCIQNGTNDNNDINTPPLFYDPNDSNNLHIASNSPCIDKGNPDGNYIGETDIDGGERIFDGDSNSTEIVDIGADEFYWIVNFVDFAGLANAWMSSSGQSNYNDIFDLEDDDLIDHNDLAVFCEGWLTQAVWAKVFTCGDGGDIMHNIGQSMSRTTTPAFAAKEAMAAALSISAEQLEKVEPIEVEQVDIEEILNWLDEVRLDPEVQKAIPEDEWLDFIESVKEEIRD